MLGLHASRDVCGTLFDSLDEDGSGTLEFAELRAKIKRKGAGSKSDRADFEKARFYRGPETPRDRLLQLLPRLGAEAPRSSRSMTLTPMTRSPAPSLCAPLFPSARSRAFKAHMVATQQATPSWWEPCAAYSLR